MAEQLKKYFQFYNKYDGFHSKAFTIKQASAEIQACLMRISADEQITFIINSIQLTEEEFKKGKVYYDA